MTTQYSKNLPRASPQAPAKVSPNSGTAYLLQSTDKDEAAQGNSVTTSQAGNNRVEEKSQGLVTGARSFHDKTKSLPNLVSKSSEDLQELIDGDTYRSKGATASNALPDKQTNLAASDPSSFMQQCVTAYAAFESKWKKPASKVESEDSDLEEATNDSNPFEKAGFSTNNALITASTIRQLQEEGIGIYESATGLRNIVDEFYSSAFVS